MSLRLGFYYHAPAILNEGGICMPGYQGRFVDSLADYCEEVTCFLHSPRPTELNRVDYRISSDNVAFVDIGPHASAIARTIRSRAYTQLLARHAAEMDMLLVRGPSPLLPAIAAKSPVPTALLLVGDYLTGVGDLPQPRWRKEAIRLWSYWNKLGQNRAARRSLTFVNSGVLFDELNGKAAYLHMTRTTTLKKDDFHFRSDTCSAPPYRLLFVGRMDRTKGLLQMVQAVALLEQRGEEVTLDLVGWPERGDTILDDLRHLAQQKGIAGRIRYLGPKPMGPELFACYLQADIFVTASLASEGFPRTIWEAMASSLPVVATRVGSIPSLVQDAAELVPPNESAALAAAISRLIHDPSRRQALIRLGIELARGNTLEAQVGTMVQTMASWLETKRV